MSEQEVSTSTVTVLLVCTGNICRSALGERLGRAYLHEALGKAAVDVHLVSAGTRSRAGSPMHPHTALVLSGFGGDPTGFRARQLAAGMVDDADLLLVLTREHRRAVLELVPRAMGRTFTLREARALLGLLDGDPPAGNAFAERVRSLVAALAAARARRSSTAEDDIVDPMGRPVEAHQEVGQAVAEALLPVLAALVALHPADPGTSTSLTSVLDGVRNAEIVGERGADRQAAGDAPPVPRRARGGPPRGGGRFGFAAFLRRRVGD